MSESADAAASLSFGDAPAGWSVTSGEADGNVGKIQASGVKKNRIRYSISGASGFSIKAKQGVVVYDGSAISADRALIVVTATDRKGKAAGASVTISVSVAGATEPVVTEPAVEVPRYEPQPTAKPHSTGFDHKHIPIKANTRRPMIAEGHRQAVMVRLTADVPDGTVVEWSIDNGGDITPYPGAKKRSAKDGFELRKDTGVLEYTGSGVPFEGIGYAALVNSGDKNHNEYLLKIRATASGYTETFIEITVCLLR